MNSSLLKLGPEAGQSFWKIDDLFEVSVDTGDTFSKWSNLVSKLRQSASVCWPVCAAPAGGISSLSWEDVRTFCLFRLPLLFRGKSLKPHVWDLRVRPTAHRADALEL